MVKDTFDRRFVLCGLQDGVQASYRSSKLPQLYLTAPFSLGAPVADARLGDKAGKLAFGYADFGVRVRLLKDPDDRALSDCWRVSTLIFPTSIRYRWFEECSCPLLV